MPRGASVKSRIRSCQGRSRSKSKIEKPYSEYAAVPPRLTSSTTTTSCTTPAAESATGWRCSTTTTPTTITTCSIEIETTGTGRGGGVKRRKRWWRRPLLSRIARPHHHPRGTGSPPFRGRLPRPRGWAGGSSRHLSSGPSKARNPCRRRTSTKLVRINKGTNIRVIVPKDRKCNSRRFGSNPTCCRLTRLWCSRLQPAASRTRTWPRRWKEPHPTRPGQSPAPERKSKPTPNPHLPPAMRPPPRRGEGTASAPTRR
mmetsp:Transcript_27869/g.81810  ORF Transcript_27869/g.81810 Transcript_27869/m.81810 type:complete len:257 (+) Transcript_27869:1324-2094(+)